MADKIGRPDGFVLTRRGTPLPVKGMCDFRPVFSLATQGRLKHGPGERHARHRHRAPFIAVVLKGSYVEAGDAGALRVGQGDVIVHGAFEAHVNLMDARGAEVLLLPTAALGPKCGASQALDQIVRLAERDVSAAAELALTTLVEPPERCVRDWPEQLAQDILADPQLSLRNWALKHGLRAETLSRGFKRVFGCAPSSYRIGVRAHAAWREVRRSGASLKAIAADFGYADQAHFTRSIVHLTGRTPARWRAPLGRTPAAEVN